MHIDQDEQTSTVAGKVATAATAATAGGDQALLDIAHDVAMNALSIAQLEHGATSDATDAAVEILELAAAELRGSTGTA